MMPIIRRVQARPDFSVEIQWEDGKTSVVSFRDTIAKGGKFTQLGNQEFFAKVHVGDDGDCLIWPDELEFGADSLWYRAHPDAPIEELEVVKE
jgi:Protein of unknown function (DUF2442)